MKKLQFLCLLACYALLAQGATARTITDSAGRKIEILDTVRRVMTAGPPASVAIYTLAPDKLVGWVRPFSPEQKQYIAKPYADLPAHGQLTGQGGTANSEVVLGMKPDLIVDLGTIDASYASLADRVQQQTGIPYVLIDGAFAKTAEVYRLLGSIVGEEKKGEELAAYVEKAIADLNARIANIPQDRRPRVYYGRGPKGLETGLAGSINLEVLAAVGATNVAAAAGRGGLTNVSLEQVIGWNPDVVLLADRAAAVAALNDPLWAGIKAIQNKQVFVPPGAPYGWFDGPPGANRLIGIRWLTAVLYPAGVQPDLRAPTREFYRIFYHVELDDGLLDNLLKDATAAPK